MPSILLFGATGYIGVPLIKALKKAHPSWPITAYVRPSRSVESVKALGVDHVATGEFSDFEKIKALSKDHEIVINAANSFTPEPVTPIAAGLKERSSKGKLIHISGGGNFLDFSTTGSFNASSKVWSDANEADIRLISKEMFNGPSDTVVLDAGKDGEVETYIVCTGIVYGGASAGSPGLGVAYNGLIANAKTIGFVPYVGDGTAVVAPTHVLDAVSFLVIIVEKAAAGSAEGSAYNRWYNVNTETRVAWKDFAPVMAKVLYEKGVFKQPEAKSVSLEQAGSGEFKYVVSANMLMDGSNAAKMGFVPKQPSILEEMKKDLEGAEIA